VADAPGRAVAQTLAAATAAAVATAVLLAGCSVLAPPDARLCSAAQNLSAAMALTATAIDADEAGDLARAQGLATQARSITELAHSLLQSMPDAAREQPTWQALLLAYNGTAQAANSLLPAYIGTHGTGPDELTGAGLQLDKARTELPAMCFSLPADVETPAPS
jgi:hypothetical protein